MDREHFASGPFLVLGANMNMKLSEALRKGAEMIGWQQAHGYLFLFNYEGNVQQDVRAACAIGCIALGMGWDPKKEGREWFIKDCIPNENMRHFLIDKNDMDRNSLEEILQLLELMEKENESESLPRCSSCGEREEDLLDDTVRTLLWVDGFLLCEGCIDDLLLCPSCEKPTMTRGLCKKCQSVYDSRPTWAKLTIESQED